MAFVCVTHLHTTLNSSGHEEFDPRRNTILARFIAISIIEIFVFAIQQ